MEEGNLLGIVRVIIVGYAGSVIFFGNHFVPFIEIIKIIVIVPKNIIGRKISKQEAFCINI